MDHADRMNTSFPGHEAISGEITANYLIFADVSDLAISDAHRDGICERMCPSLQVGVYRPHSTLPWDHRSLIIRLNAGRYGVWCHCEGHVGRMGGQILRLGASGGLGFNPVFGLFSGSIYLSPPGEQANTFSHPASSQPSWRNADWNSYGSVSA